jgi:AcrR family transcriptional regulator
MTTTTTKRWTGRSLDARRAERREMLIAAGVRLYGSQGFHGTGVRAICREAGLTERYFYESFANGEELLLAAFNEVIQALLIQIVEADEPAKAAEHRVRRMLGAYYAALRAHPAAARVFLVEIVGVSPGIDTAIRQSMHDLSTPLFAALASDRNDHWRGDPLLRRGIEGGLLHIALDWGAHNYAQSVDAVINAAWPLCMAAATGFDDKPIMPL